MLVLLEWPTHLTYSIIVKGLMVHDAPRKHIHSSGVCKSCADIEHRLAFLWENAQVDNWEVVILALYAFVLTFYQYFKFSIVWMLNVCWLAENFRICRRPSNWPMNQRYYVAVCFEISKCVLHLIHCGILTYDCLLVLRETFLIGNH